MAAKRTLVVDDSKSARFVLKRMLNELGLSVDTVESAADALEYLTQHRPDVIFMDHMMPGMDGLEATRRIKENPATAAIPILMYTSKGGEVYLSQVRALGAVGIIPKTIAPVELKESLLELGLIKDLAIKSTLKIDNMATSPALPNARPEPSTKKKNVLDIYLQDLRKLMDEQTIELHKSMWLGIESVSHEIFNRLNTEFEEKLNKIYPPDSAMPDRRTHGNRKTNWLIVLISLMFVVSIIFNYVLYQNNNDLNVKLEADNRKPDLLKQKSVSDIKIESGFNNQTAINQETLPAETRFTAQPSQSAKLAFIQWTKTKKINYPFNELALNENRVTAIDEIINRALQAGYKGHIILQIHVGKFCMVSDDSGNFEVESRNIAVTDCQFIDNNTQKNDQPTTYQSVSFANYLSGMGWLVDAGIFIEIDSSTGNIELVDYPVKSQHTTAQLWNEAAQQNNSITIKLEP